MIIQKINLTALAIWVCSFSFGQNFTHQDTLRGSITPERIWWDLNFYDLTVKVDPTTKSITGKNIIRYKVLDEKQVLQVDLQPPLKIEKITQDGKTLEFQSDINAHFVTLQKPQKRGISMKSLCTIPASPKWRSGRLGMEVFPGPRTTTARILSPPPVKDWARVFGGPARTTCTMR